MQNNTKLLFSKLISEVLDEKIENLQNYNANEFFKKDEYFELALCLAYLIHSKEIIIDKDKKNKEDPTGRLTEKVDKSEIEKVFQPGFANEMPVFDETITDIKDPVWRLDNIRDAFMHGHFGVNNENKCFIIDITKKYKDQTHRMLATIPFSWFLEYAKNNIIGKKFSNDYTVEGLFLDQSKKGDFMYYDKAINESIFYNVRIKSDNGFNIRRVEDNIRSMFEMLSNESNREEDNSYKKYYDLLKKEGYSGPYDISYLAKFLAVSDYVKKYIGWVVPDGEIEINIVNNKDEILNKMKTQYGIAGNQYEKLAYEINHKIYPQSIGLLRYIRGILRTINGNSLDNNSPIKYKDAEKVFRDTIYYDIPMYNDVYNADSYITSFDSVFYTYRMILAMVYGINTLAINYEDEVYDKSLENCNPMVDFNVSAKLMDPIKKYVEQREKKISKILDKYISIEDKKSQKSSNHPETFQTIQNSINSKQQQITELEEELSKERDKASYYLIPPEDGQLKAQFDNICFEIDKKTEEFHLSHNIQEKIALKNELLQLYAELGKIELKYRYNMQYTMEDVLNIIRNCVSHPGRTNLDFGYLFNFVDYSNDGSKSGEVTIDFQNLISLFKKPLLEIVDDKNMTL